MSELKKISVRINKEDIRILQVLCADYGETMTNIFKHALHFLYHSRNIKEYLKNDWLLETLKNQHQPMSKDDE